MKVLITTSSFAEFDKTPVEKLKNAGVQIVSNPYGRKLTLQESMQLYSSDIDGVIAGTEEINKDVLAKAESLKVISRCGVGLDNIDLGAAEQRKIKIFKSASGITEAVAELTLGLILNCVRSITYADHKIRDGHWVKPMGSLLSQKTLGIIGLGKIGKKLVELVSGFQMRILAHDPQPDNSFAQQHHLKYVAIDELLKMSDIVSIHTTLNSQTELLINKERFKLFKKEAFLINTSRANILDEQALYEALKNNRLAGAGLDVFNEEPYTGPLTQLNNIVLTSHIGSYAKEARIAMEHQAVDQLLNALRN